MLYLHWVYTRVRPVANFTFALGLHARQTCCKFHVCIRFTPEAKLLQMSYLPKVCNRFALYGFAADARFSNAFAYLQTRSLYAWQIWQIYANSDFATLFALHLQKRKLNFSPRAVVSITWHLLYWCVKPGTITAFLLIHFTVYLSNKMIYFWQCIYYIEIIFLPIWLFSMYNCCSFAVFHSAWRSSSIWRHFNNTRSHCFIPQTSRQTKHTRQSVQRLSIIDDSNDQLWNRGRIRETVERV